MSAANGQARIIPIGAELPPMESASERSGNARPKGKTAKRTAGERFGVLNAFVDFTAGTLSRSELLVWLTLFRDARDGIARTAQADIARRTGLNARTVRRAIQRLARGGLLAVVHRGGIGRGPSSYRLHGTESNRT
jgi:hypothetical protein